MLGKGISESVDMVKMVCQDLVTNHDLLTHKHTHWLCACTTEEDSNYWISQVQKGICREISLAFNGRCVQRQLCWNLTCVWCDCPHIQWSVSPVRFHSHLKTGLCNIPVRFHLCLGAVLSNLSSEITPVVVGRFMWSLSDNSPVFKDCFLWSLSDILPVFKDCFMWSLSDISPVFIDCFMWSL